jgi:5-methylcytosine-specific restriction endonuclease McrA
MSAYSDKLKNPKWQRRRLEVMSRDKFACTLCKDIESELQVHHLAYFKEPWNAPSGFLATLCCHCHLAVEIAKNIDKEFPKKSIKRIEGKEVTVVLFYKSFRIIIISVNKKAIFLYCPNDFIHQIHNTIIDGR